MTDSTRLEDLRRRVRQDPASIAFAQLAEECRRAGHLDEAIATARTGLARHPGYVSARLTLGRALFQSGRLDDAHGELSEILLAAPDNLSAIRTLADVQRRRGDLTAAYDLVCRALRLAPNDPELERQAHELESAARAQAEAARRVRAERVLARLESWLTAIHAARA